MTDLERLTKLVGESPHNAKAAEVAAFLLAKGVTLPPQPKRAWVVTDEAVGSYVKGSESRARGHEVDRWRRAGLAAAAPHLVRAWIAGLTDAELIRIGWSAMRIDITRAHLLNATQSPA